MADRLRAPEGSRRRALHRYSRARSVVRESPAFPVPHPLRRVAVPRARRGSHTEPRLRPTVPTRYEPESVPPTDLPCSHQVLADETTTRAAWFPYPLPTDR